MKSKAIIVSKLFEGFPKETDFEIVDEPHRNLNDGEFLAEAVYISVDPYMRSFIEKRHVGKTMFAEQIARVVLSKNENFAVGDYILGEFGWKTLTISDGKKQGFPSLEPRKLPKLNKIPKSLFLGMLGMTGCTAYLALDSFKPKKGKTIVITAAAGAVGSHAGQIASLKDLRVVGVAGTEEKCKWLTETLGFDAAVNYRSSNFGYDLKEATPDGIDYFFDSVGGEISTIIMNMMNKFGKVIVVGCISTYNEEEKEASEVQTAIKINHLKVQGFSVFNSVDRWDEAYEQNKKWIEDGKIKYRETVTKGFENTHVAFINMLKGGNIGKAIVEV